MTQVEIFNYKQQTWRKTQIHEFEVTTPRNFNIRQYPPAIQTYLKSFGVGGYR